jgi:hypothetical protein
MSGVGLPPEVPSDFPVPPADEPETEAAPAPTNERPIPEVAPGLPARRPAWPTGGVIPEVAPGVPHRAPGGGIFIPEVAPSVPTRPPGGFVEVRPPMPEVAPGVPHRAPGGGIFIPEVAPPVPTRPPGGFVEVRPPMPEVAPGVPHRAPGGGIFIPEVAPPVPARPPAPTGADAARCEAALEKGDARAAVQAGDDAMKGLMGPSMGFPHLAPSPDPADVDRFQGFLGALAKDGKLDDFARACDKVDADAIAGFGGRRPMDWFGQSETFSALVDKYGTAAQKATWQAAIKGGSGEA